MATVQRSGSDHRHLRHTTRYDYPRLRQRQRFLRLNQGHDYVVTSTVYSLVQTFQQANFRVCEVMP